MILMLFQFTFRLWPEFILIVILPILLLSEIITLKIALKITKAEERRKFKFCAMSFLIQAGVILFIASPLILLGLAGGFDEYGPNPLLIIATIALAIFIELNLLNVIHKIGIKRALIVFGIMMIPVVILGVLVSILVASSSYMQF